MKNGIKVFVVMVGLLMLTACGASVNGTYAYEGDLVLVSDVVATMTIKGEEGSLHLKGNTLGFVSSEDDVDITVDPKEKTIIAGTTTLTYEIKDGDLVIVSDSSGFFTDKVFKKQ